MKSDTTRRHAALTPFVVLLAVLSIPFSPLLSGCSRGKGESAAGGGPGGRGGRPGAGGPPAVDVVLAREGELRPELEYTGTTRASREVTLRAQTEGRLLSLAADVGDRVQRGQVVARLDDDLQQTAVNQAQAELANRQSEVASAQIAVNEAQTLVEQARIDLTQRRADAGRAEYLAREGAGSRQIGEQARTAARTAEQVLRSQIQQVRNRQAAVRAAQARVAAQRAVVAQERERLSYSVLRSPVTGFVTAKLSDVGNLVQPGGEVLRVGDFRVAQVDVQVSELELPRVSQGQPVRVRLDAFGGRAFPGRVDRISPQADPTTRLVPVTVTLPNDDSRIGGGLLARVRFGRTSERRVVIPEAAFQAAKSGPGGGGGERGGQGSPGGGGGRQGGPGGERGGPNGGGGGGGGVQVQEARAGATGSGDEETTETVFVLVGEGEPAQPPRGGGGEGSGRESRREDAPAEAPRGGARAHRSPARVYRVEQRQVRVGARADGQAEILSGLRPGDRVVSRSAGPLKDGATVRPSILSEEALAPRPEQGAAGQAQSRGQEPGVAQQAPVGLPQGRAPVGQGDAGQAGTQSRGPGAASPGGAPGAQRGAAASGPQQGGQGAAGSGSQSPTSSLSTAPTPSRGTTVTGGASSTGGGSGTGATGTSIGTQSSGSGGR